MTTSDVLAAGVPLVLELARALIPAGGMNATKFAAWWDANVTRPLPPDIEAWAEEDARVEAALADPPDDAA